MESTDNPDLRLVGGHPALDLINTVEPRVPGAAPEKEHLNTPQELLDWAVRARVVRADEVPRIQDAWRGEQALAAALAIREALYAAVMIRLDQNLGSRLPYQASLEQLATRYAAAAARARLALAFGVVAAANLKFGEIAEFAVQDRLAQAAIDLLTTENIDAFRVCPLDDGGCGWVFLDRSRNHSRRWCAMADCGARVKARRLTSRRRAAQ
ncbi:CGNR zinc finger domain-containing protein [Dactylosporangium sp. NPDC048998]|uniref:CGNR zinc finger domain-containing protein n=1 Tax=Dactylosporangium sp. NPDC048998 TaxID=3363976 RepID=UPI003713C487